MKNPWLSLWLSAANQSAGAARGFWTAEMRRQQAAMAKEIGRVAEGGRGAKAKRPAAKRSKKGRA